MNLYKDKAHGKFFGVCAGLADFLGIDVTIMRLFLTVGMFLFPPLLVIYLLLALILPNKPIDNPDNKPSHQHIRQTLNNIAIQLQEIEQHIKYLESYVTSDEFEFRRKFM